MDDKKWKSKIYKFFLIETANAFFEVHKKLYDANQVTKTSCSYPKNYFDTPACENVSPVIFFSLGKRGYKTEHYCLLNKL